jgi:hypothetical protein
MRETRSIRRLALPLALVAAVAAACGGSGGPSTSPSTSARASSPGRSATPTPLAPSPTSRTAPPSATPQASGGGATNELFKGLEKCPQRPDCYIYVVKRGDTLSRIASKFKTTVAAIRKINPEIKNAAQIRVADEVRVPSK